MAMKSLGGIAVVLLSALLSSLLATENVQPAPAEAIRAEVDRPAAGDVLAQAMQTIHALRLRMQAQANLRQIGLAMLSHADDMKGRLLPRASYDKNGKAMLSWRVLLLPYLGQKDLYGQFHLNEPWDSDHNKKLLDKMPKVFTSPQDEKTLKEHTTHYQVLVGKGTIYESKQAMRLQEITDGLAFTILIAEAPKAVPWTKPEDIPYDPDKPPPKLGLRGDRNFSVLMASGDVRFFSPALTDQTLRLMITWNDGLPLGSDF
jgi:hypothetical protein